MGELIPPFSPLSTLDNSLMYGEILGYRGEKGGGSRAKTYKAL